QVEAGVVYQYAVKSKDNTGKASTLSDLIEATLMVESAADKGRARLEFQVHALPAQLVYRADLEQFPADFELCGDRLALSANNLYITENVKAPEALWDLEMLIPTAKQFRGITWSKDCELIYIAHVPSGQIWVVDPEGTTTIGEENYRGEVVQKLDLPKPPEGPPEEEGTLYYISMNTSGEEVVVQRKEKTVTSDVAIDLEGNLVISDLANSRLLRVTPEGEFIETILYESGEEVSNSPAWAIDKPGTLTIDDEGNIFVSSINRIVQVTPEGEKNSIGGGGTIFGTFTSIKGISQDAAGDLYATDGRAGNVQVFRYQEAYKDQINGGWLPTYIVTNETKKANVNTLTPAGLVITEDGKNMVLLESMSKTLAYFNLQRDKADAVQYPSLEEK
ncbi:MAG: hypothetical protein P1S46_10425, partial [bacterium]|nr:hypothetical protein [bacterium]